MKFTYENQGAITYLVCELDPIEQLDTLTLGMLTNNHIAGFAPVVYTEMNGQRYLKYNISAKVTADQFFAGSMNKQRALTAFRNILSAICSADDYMIDLNSFLVDSDHIYLNVSSCETALICIPVISDKDINSDVAALFKKIMFSTQFDNSEDASYITQLITYINGGTSFTVYGLQELVSKLQSGAPVVSQVAPTAPGANQQSSTQPAQQSAASASPFDSTISIDDMPAMMAQKQQTQQGQPPVQIPVTPIQPAQPQISPQNNVAVPAQVAIPIQPPVQNFGVQTQSVKPQQPAVPQRPAEPKGPGFAIPGQQRGYIQTPPAPPVEPQKKNAKKAEPVGGKKMSLFGLLSNYSKENAELYKKQKEEEKARKAAANVKSAQKPVVPAVPVPNQMPCQQPPAAVPSMGVPLQQQQYNQPQYQPPIRPVPVQNSFNETTVLSPSMMSGGETTVLSASDVGPNPALTRVKTGERISINKPVFRIGKEKSYVDYFIGDNTAISRSHANIHTDNGEYYIEDTNSTNHTYVNGKLISSNVKVKLVSGDKVRLANEDFTFSL